MKLSIAEGLYLIALDDEEGRLLAAADKYYIDGIQCDQIKSFSYT
jgi:hypothetical protein